MSDEELGPDLIARLLGQLPPDDAFALEAKLADDPGARGEEEEIRGLLEAARAAVPQVEPGPEGLSRLLAAVRHEARERRAAAGADAPVGPIPEAQGELVTALALGQLEGDELRQAEELIRTSPACAEELAAVRRLVDASRAEPALEPAQDCLQAIRAAIRAGAPAAEGDEGPGVPGPPRDRRKGGRLRIVGWLIPLAAAAAAVVAVSLDGVGPTAAHVEEGHAVVFPHGGTNTIPSWHADPRTGSLEFPDGQEIAADVEPAVLVVQCGEPPSGVPAPHAGAPPAGTVRLTLRPGSRLRRTSVSAFELVGGTVDVAAGTLGEALEVRHGPLFARVLGTRFTVSAFQGRLVVVVETGMVLLGRDGGESVEVAAGRQALVDPAHLLERPVGDRAGVDAFLAPRVTARVASGGGGTVTAGSPLDLEVVVEAGEAGAVDVAPFGDAQPILVARLRGPDGRERDVKLLRSMRIPGETGTSGAPVRLTEQEPYRLAFRIPGLDLWPGAWEVSVRYTSYRADRGGREAADPVWVGVAESAPAPLLVETPQGDRR